MSRARAGNAKPANDKTYDCEELWAENGGRIAGKKPSAAERAAFERRAASLYGYEQFEAPSRGRAKKRVVQSLLRPHGDIAAALREIALATFDPALEAAAAALDRYGFAGRDFRDRLNELRPDDKLTMGEWYLMSAIAQDVRGGMTIERACNLNVARVGYPSKSHESAVAVVQIKLRDFRARHDFVPLRQEDDRMLARLEALVLSLSGQRCGNHEDTTDEPAIRAEAAE